MHLCFSAVSHRKVSQAFNAIKLTMQSSYYNSLAVKPFKQFKLSKCQTVMLSTLSRQSSCQGI